MAWRARLSRQVQQLTFRFCAEDAKSEGLRNFIRTNYEDLKLLNPRLSFTVRPADGYDAIMTARYDYGEEKELHLNNKTVEEVEEGLKSLSELGSTMKRSNESVPKDFDIIQTFPEDENDPQVFTSVGAVRSGELPNK